MISLICVYFGPHPICFHDSKCAVLCLIILKQNVHHSESCSIQYWSNSFHACSLESETQIHKSKILENNMCCLQMCSYRERRSAFFVFSTKMSWFLFVFRLWTAGRTSSSWRRRLAPPLSPSTTPWASTCRVAASCPWRPRQTCCWSCPTCTAWMLARSPWAPRGSSPRRPMSNWEAPSPR